MIVSEAEFKTGIERYLDLVSEEEIVITKDGKQVAKLTAVANSPEEKAAIIRSLRDRIYITTGKRSVARGKEREVFPV